MKIPLIDLRPVYVIGIGLHPYQRPGDQTYVELGLRAIREAIEDARCPWEAVDSVYVGNTLLGMAPGRGMLKHLGATGLPIAHVENASATGSTAVRQACIEVATGTNDICAAIGVDKITDALMNFANNGTEQLVDLLPVDYFALLTNEYMKRYGAAPEDIASVSVKNHGNASNNPYAHFQKKRTLGDVLKNPVSGILTRLQCCPLGEGAASVIIASETGIKKLGIDKSRAVQIISSVSRSERVYGPGKSVIVELTKETAQQAFNETGIMPDELDIVEMHDAFAIEELLYTEALGLCDEGKGTNYLKDGKSQIGGECAVSPSGGLLAMGHPFGPTGIGQVVEITKQLRGEAGKRQQPNAKLGLCHMVGIGQVCLIHILRII